MVPFEKAMIIFLSAINCKQVAKFLECALWKDSMKK